MKKELKEKLREIREKKRSEYGKKKALAVLNIPDFDCNKGNPLTEITINDLIREIERANFIHCNDKFPYDYSYDCAFLSKLSKKTPSFRAGMNLTIRLLHC